MKWLIPVIALAGCTTFRPQDGTFCIKGRMVVYTVYLGHSDHKPECKAREFFKRLER